MYVICPVQVNAQKQKADRWLLGVREGETGGGDKSDCRQVQSCSLGMMEMFWNQINVVTVAQHCECTKCHWIVQFKRVKIVYFMLYIFHYNEKI